MTLLSAVSLLLLLACGVDCAAVRSLLQERRTLSAQEDHVQRQLVGLTAPKAPDFSPDQVKWIHSTIRALNTPWDDVFDGLESHTTNDTALLTVTPDGNTQSGHGRLRMIAEAKDLDAAFVYLDGLRAAPKFESVQLSKQEVIDRDPNRPFKITFDVNLESSR